MKIGIDIDNVLSNFNDTLLKYYLKHDKRVNNKGIINKNAYIREMFDWDKDDEKAYYHNNIERLAKSLRPLPYASKYLKKIKEQGNEIYIISGRDNGEYQEPYSLTVEWLKKYNLFYDKLYLTNTYNFQEKVDICKKIGIDIMIDDSITVCTKCQDNNIETILFATDFNKQVKGFKRLSTWKEIYNYVINKKINVILDTDTYNECDDQFALTYLIKNQKRFNIEAITIAPFSHEKRDVSVVEGQELSYNEVKKICNYLKFNTKNKVFKGSMDYYQNGYRDNNDAVRKIIEVALKNKKTYLLGIGAITNIALAIEKEPKIIDRIEIIWLGGNQIGYKDNLEYNFRQDVDAVRKVFDSKVRLTILPCNEVVSKLMIDVHTLRKNIGNRNALYDYLIERFYNDGYHGIQEKRVIWDIAVIAYMINRNWFKENIISCPNIKHDTSYELTDNHHQIIMISDINKNKVYEDLFNKFNNINN